MIPYFNAQEFMDTFRIRGEEAFYIRVGENEIGLPIARGDYRTAERVATEYLTQVKNSVSQLKEEKLDTLVTIAEKNFGRLSELQILAGQDSRLINEFVSSLEGYGVQITNESAEVLYKPNGR